MGPWSDDASIGISLFVDSKDHGVIIDDVDINGSSVDGVVKGTFKGGW